MTNEVKNAVNLIKEYLTLDKDIDGNEYLDSLRVMVQALESSISIPSGATNGDVIKAVFGAEFIRNTLYGVVIDLDGEIELSDDWWFAPYREGMRNDIYRKESI